VRIDAFATLGTWQTILIDFHDFLEKNQDGGDI
jgi:hypothetical protein